MWPEFGLCLGTVRQATLIEFTEVAGQNGFPTITASPQMVERALADGTTASELKQRLVDLGLRISYLDALTSEVPGAAAAESVPELWRSNWAYGLDDLLRMAEALDIPIINVSHFMGAPVSEAATAEGIGSLAAHTSQPSEPGYSVSERSLPGEGDAPLAEFVSAIVHNTPDVAMEFEVFNSALASVLPEQAAVRVASALRTWRASVERELSSLLRRP